jgi:hypothetical protein
VSVVSARGLGVSDGRSLLAGAGREQALTWWGRCSSVGGETERRGDRRSEL